MKRQSTRAALREIKGAGLSVPEVWEFYRDNRQNNATPVSISTAATSFLEAKQAGGRRPAYLNGLRHELIRLCDHFDRSRGLSILSVHTMSIYLATLNQTPKAQIATMGRLQSFFSWCRKQGWIDSNPLQGMDRPMMDETLPEILGLAKCKLLVNWAERHSPEAVTYVCFCLFLGVRRSEFLKLTEYLVIQSTHTGTNPPAIVKIPAEASKTRKVRWIDMPRNVLVMWQKHGLKIPTRHKLATMIHDSGFRFSQNALRHTAASYMVARLQSAEKAALQLGNSAPTLHRYYLNPIDPSQVEEFYSIGL